jgi:imidazolonepropionase-like amidohydrolase
MDLNLKQQIDLGQVPGPEMFVTSPILNGPGSKILDGKVIRSEEDARRSVRYWAAEGVTSFKVYRQITKEALAAIIDEAHRLGVPITAHLQSVSCRDAVELGIDNLEHGFGPCFSTDKLETDPAGPRAQALIRTLVDKKVTITLTPGALFFRRLSDRELDFLDPGVRERYLREQSGRGSASSAQAQRVLEIAGRFDLAFARAGGRLVLGSDANCCSLGHFAGASGKFALENLVREGFSPLEAIRIATLNGALFLGIADRTGTIAVGKEADLLVVRGNPSARIEDIEYIETVWSNGVGYDRRDPPFPM